MWANSWPIFFGGEGGGVRVAYAQKVIDLYCMFFQLTTKLIFNFTLLISGGLLGLFLKVDPRPRRARAAHRLHIYSATVHIPVLKLFCLAILRITVLSTCIYSSSVVVRIDKINKLKEYAIERKAITSTVL